MIFFQIQFRLRKGCSRAMPCRPLLYVLCVEVLACKMWQRHQRLSSSMCRRTVTQYADDTTAFVKDESSLFSHFKVISAFKSGSGAKLNRS